MHMCWLGGHVDAEYTPLEYLRRGAKASLSVIRLPSCRKTASVPATSRNPKPRTSSEPCWTTAARKASRCSAAQRGRHHALGRGARLLVALLGDIEFSGERQECLTINLPVPRKWQRFPPMDRRRNHVLGERLGEPVPHHAGIRGTIA